MNRRIAGDAHLKTRQAALLDELRAADLNGDGHLELEEVAELLINEMHAKDEAVLQAKRTRVMRKYVLLLALMVFVMLLGNFGLTFAVVTMAKDTKISASAELQTLVESCSWTDTGALGDGGEALAESDAKAKTLDLSDNQLTGGLEPLRGCVALQTLELRINQLTGGLEPLRGCVALQTLWLSGNQLTPSEADQAHFEEKVAIFSI